MRKIYLLLVVLLLSATLFGQAPASFKYQTVIRNSSGQLITNTQVTIQIAILRGNISGDQVYTETFSPTTNDFGLVNLNIGAGTVIAGNFETIDWGADTYFIKVLLNSTEMGTSQLLSVPYALYANIAETISADAINGNENAFTGWDKNSLDDFDGKYSSLSNVPTFANVATTGSYNDLTNKPILFDGSWTSLTGKPAFADVATSGSYSDLSNKPTLFDGTWASLTGKPTFSTVATSGLFADLLSKPTTLSGYGISDAMSISHIANGITETNINNWNNAFGWGNHSIAGYLKSEVDGSITNEIQQLSLTGNNLSLSKDGLSVDLTKYLDNSDAQNLSLTDNVLSLTNDATTVDLSKYLDNTDDQGLILTGDILTIENGTGNIDLANYIDDADPYPINELQYLEYSNDTLYLSQGNFVVLNYYDINNNGIVIGYNGTCNEDNEGLIRYNSSTQRLNYCNGSVWVEISGINVCTPAPTSANAGKDSLNINGSTITLYANTPTEGTGVWSIINGEDGSFNNVNNPIAVFQGVPGNTYTLRWTITNNCGSSYDEIQINFSLLPFVEHNGKLYVHPINNGYRQWGAWGTVVGASSMSNGESNSQLIVQTLGPGSYAAYLCDTLTAYGYDDWYLPAIEELNAVWARRFELNFDDHSYWSSTESNYQLALDKVFNTYGTIYAYWKNDNGIGVRCVRRDE